MSKYSVEEVRVEADELRAAGYDSTANMMIAYAERIEADESAVPVWRDGAPNKPWSGEWFIAIMESGDRVVLRELPDEYTYDFTTADDTYVKRDRIKRWMQFPDSQFIHPPSQAAQVDHTMGDLAHRDAEPVVQGDPNIPSARDDLTLQLIELTEERDHLRSILAAQLRAATTAEPVAQGEAAVCIEDNSSLYRRAAGNLSMMLSLARNELHADEQAAMKKLIDDLQSAQPHAVPGGWALVPVEPTMAMLENAQRSNEGRQLPRFSVLRTRWKAMLAAAPSPETKA